MQDRPSIHELLEAVEQFLERDVVPALKGPKQFHARVAANVMRILSREVELGAAAAREEWRRLDALLGSEPLPEEGPARGEGIARRTRALCAKIRAGEADEGPWGKAVLQHVRKTVEEKLAVAKPELLKR